MCAGVAINKENIKIEGAVGADGEFGDSLEAWERCRGPGGGVVGGDEE